MKKSLKSLRTQDGFEHLSLLVIVGVVFVMALAGYTVMKHRQKASVNQPSLTKVSVRLEWVNNPEFAGMYVAEDKGFYRDAGLSVNLEEYNQSADVNKEVSTGRVDYGVSTPLEVVLAHAEGETTKAVAAIYQTSPFSIATSKSANIKTPADFRGKILGDTGDNNEAKVTYAVLMANAGLQPSDATIKPVDFDPLVVFQKQQAQTADLYRNDQTYKLKQAGIQYNQIFPEQFGFSIYGDVLIASDAKIKQNPAQVKAFTQATLRGWQYVINHPAEAEAITLRHANTIYKDPAYDKYVLDSTIPFIKPTDNSALGSMQFIPWNRAFQGVKAAGLLTHSYEVSDLYTSQFVQ